MWRFNVDRFSVLIDLWLEMHEITNAEFAELIGIGVSTLYQLKRGDITPTMAQLVNVCNMTQMPPDTFFKKELGKKNG